MSWEVQWEDDAHTILRQTYWGKITLDDFIGVVQETEKYLASVAHPVDIINDMTGCTFENKSILQAVRRSDRELPSNQRLVVVLGLPIFIKAILTLLRTVAPRLSANVQLAESVEEAHQTIREYRASLSVKSARS